MNDPLVDSHIRVLRETGGDDGATYHFAIFSETRPAILRRVRRGVSGSTVGPAALARSMRAEHVVPLLSFRATEDLGYVLEDYIKGISLQDILDTGRPMRWDVAAQIVASAAKAIDAVRKKLGANVRHISADRILVTFAGGTWFADSTRELRGTETTKLSFRALSPEEAADAVLGSRRDQAPATMDAGEREIVFSLGLLLRDLLQGSAFHRATSLDASKLECARFETARALEGIESPARAILDRALAKPAADRFSSLLGFEVALRALPLATTQEVATYLGETWSDKRADLEAWLDSILSESTPLLESPDSSEDIATRAFRRSSRTDAPAAAAAPPPPLGASLAPLPPLPKPPPPPAPDRVKEALSSSLVPEASPTIKSLPEDEPDEDEEARTAPFSREELLSRFQRSPSQPTVPPKHLLPKPRISGASDAAGRYVHISSNPPVADADQGSAKRDAMPATLGEPVTREVPVIASLATEHNAETAVVPVMKLPVVHAESTAARGESPKPPSSRRLPPSPSADRLPAAPSSQRLMPRPPSSGNMVVREEWKTSKAKDPRREVEDDSRTRPFSRAHEARTKTEEAHSRPILEVRDTGEFDAAAPDTARSEPEFLAAPVAHAPPAPYVSKDPGASVIVSSSVSRIEAQASPDQIPAAPRTDPDFLSGVPKSSKQEVPPSLGPQGIPETQRESAQIPLAAPVPLGSPTKPRTQETAPMTPYVEAAPVIATPILQTPVSQAAPVAAHAAPLARTDDSSGSHPQDATAAMVRRKTAPNSRQNDPTIQVATQRRRSAWLDVVLLIAAIGIVSTVAYVFFSGTATTPATPERPRAATAASSTAFPSLALIPTGSAAQTGAPTSPGPILSAKKAVDPSPSSLPARPSMAPTADPSALGTEAPTSAPVTTAAPTASGTLPEADASAATPRAYVTVICDPWCDQVEEGGQKLGASPLVRISMSPGKHVFRLHWSEPVAEKTAVVDAKEGETTVLRVSP